MKNIFVISLFISVFFIPEALIAQKHKHRHRHAHPARKQQIQKRKQVKRTMRIYKRSQLRVVKRRPTPVVIAKLPAGHLVMKHQGSSFYYHQGIFYRKNKSAFVRTFPPQGIRLRQLPTKHHVVINGNKKCYYLNGVYYAKTEVDKEGPVYEVISPEAGSVVPDIPTEYAEKVEIDNESYYLVEGLLYQKNIGKEGDSYTVIGQVES